MANRLYLSHSWCVKAVFGGAMLCLSLGCGEEPELICECEPRPVQELGVCVGPVDGDWETMTYSGRARAIYGQVVAAERGRVQFRSVSGR